MTKIELQETVFLYVYRDPNLSKDEIPSLELIERVTTRKVETIDTKTYSKKTYSIQIKKNGDIIFPNIPKVSCVESFCHYGITEELKKRKKNIFDENERLRILLKNSLAEIKKLEALYAKLAGKSPVYFRDLA